MFFHGTRYDHKTKKSKQKKHHRGSNRCRFDTFTKQRPIGMIRHPLWCRIMSPIKPLHRFCKKRSPSQATVDTVTSCLLQSQRTQKGRRWLVFRSFSMILVSNIHTNHIIHEYLKSAVSKGFLTIVLGFLTAADVFRSFSECDLSAILRSWNSKLLKSIHRV